MKILKILFMTIIGITLVLSPAYGASKGKAKGKIEKAGGASNGKSNKGRSNARVESAGGKSNTNQPSNARAARPTPKPERRRKLIERTREQADARANRPDKNESRNSAIKRDRGRGAGHRRVKDSLTDDLLKALERARWSHNRHDERGQGNMGKPNMKDPYGHDRDSGREKSERDRPIPVEPEQPLLDLAGIVATDFEVQDYMLAYLKSSLTNYLSLARINDFMTRWVAYYESLVEGYLDKYSEYRVRVNMKDKIDYTMKFSPPEGFKGTKLTVTTTLTSVDDYKYSTWHYTYGPATDTGHWEPHVIKYDAGQVVMEQNQEIVLGEDNSLSFNYDPSSDLAGFNGFNANLSVTVTEPVSGQSYTMSPDKQIYLYRCPYGKVTNAKTDQPIVGAKVTVHFEDGSIVPLDKASNPTATNPQVTDATGRYGVKLQTNRKYYITATAPGYKPYKSEIFTEKWHVLREDIKLTPIDQVASGR